MRRSLAVLRRRSLRFRITLAFVAGAAILAAVLSAATILTVRRFLEDQRVRSSTRQTLFAVLFAREFIASRPAPQELVSRLQIHRPFDALVTTGDDWFGTRIELTPDSVPEGLRTIVLSEGFGYEVNAAGADRVLVFGSPLPPPQTDLYLFFPLQDIDETMSLLIRALTVTGLAVVVLMGLLARRTSTRILQPLAAVSEASHRMAQGLLETRVEPRTSDELGQLAASFNRMGEALRDMIEHERRFVAAASHELRTPLAALQTAVGVAAAHRDRLPPDGQEALDLMREDVISLQQLVNDLLEVSELDSRRAKVRIEEVDLRALVETILRRRRRDASVEGEDVQILTDKARLERIIGNLVDNAYTHGEGRDVRVSLISNSAGVHVSVSDRGPGVLPEDVPLLFRRFTKLDRSRTRERSGVGLGLAIAQENARLLGGRVTLTGAPADGATFTLTLPLRSVAESSPA